MDDDTPAAETAPAPSKKRKRNGEPAPPRVEPGSLSETPELDTAILNAQRAIQRVAKDGKNTTHGFAYALGDDIVEAARNALHAQDCKPARLGWEFRRVDGVSELMVEVGFEILHVPTGQARRESVLWPIITAHKQGLDKATAAALTGCWSYWLVGELAIPRKNEDQRGADMDGRNDNPPPTPRPARPEPTKEQWLAAAARWKKKGEAMAANGQTGPAAAEALDALLAVATDNPFDRKDGLADVKWPPHIIAKLRRYFAGFKRTVLYETPPEPSAKGATQPAADSAPESPPTAEDSTPEPSDLPPGWEVDPNTGERIPPAGWNDDDKYTRAERSAVRLGDDK